MSTEGPNKFHPLTEVSKALAKPVSWYEKKARRVCRAMEDIYSGGYTFEQTAEFHNCRPEELGVAFAVFGMQAMDLIEAQRVVSALLFPIYDTKRPSS